MATRVEFYRPVSVAGRESQLYVSSGPSDDYLEISLPQDVDPNSSTLCGLRDLPNTNNDLSVDFYEGDPALISVTALYINDPRRKSSSSKERVAEILSNLVRVAPILDFGDLLPKRIEAVESPVVEASVAPAALSQEAEAPVITSPARDEVQATARRAARVEKMSRARDLVARGQVHKALRILDDLLRESPNLLEAEDLAAALKLLDKREKRACRESRNPQAHLEVGFSYLQLDRNRDAATSLRKATQLSPDLYLAHLLLGIALHRVGDLILARNAYRAAARLKPEESTPGDLLTALEKGEPPFRLAEATPERRANQPKIPHRQLAWAG